MSLLHFSMEHFLETYGYVAVFIGTFLEGEAILVLGGLAAKMGHLDLKNVIITAMLGTTLGDQLYFFIGRRYGKRLLTKYPKWQPRADKLDRLFNKWDIALVLSFRFMYGLRTVASFAFGMSSIPTKKFIFLNILGALLWSTTIGSAGYLIGHAFELFIDDVKNHQLLLFVCVLLVFASIWLFLYWRNRQKIRSF